MRENYPVSSIEFNDKILMAYENLVYLLGVQTDTALATGLYDIIDASGEAYMTSVSGIPHCGTLDSKYQVGLYSETTQLYVITYLKTDYIMRKYLDLI